MSFEGGIRLDGTLDLTGTVNLTPQTIKKLTLGKVTPTEAVPVALKLTGKAWSPRGDGDGREAGGDDHREAWRRRGWRGSCWATRARRWGRSSPAASRTRAKEAERKAEGAGARPPRRRRSWRRRRGPSRRGRSKKAEDEAKKRLRGIFGK